MTKASSQVRGIFYPEGRKTLHNVTPRKVAIVAVMVAFLWMTCRCSRPRPQPVPSITFGSIQNLTNDSAVSTAPVVATGSPYRRTNVQREAESDIAMIILRNFRMHI